MSKSGYKLQMSNPSVMAIAHRGASEVAPENTLAGLRMAKELGFAGVEFDVMLADPGA